MDKKNSTLFVFSAVIIAFAMFGCSSGTTADTTAPGSVIDGAALYSSDCSGCHGSLAVSGKKGASVSQIQNAIAHNWGGMGAYASLTPDQLQAIVTALSSATVTTPATAGTNTTVSLPTSVDGAALYATNCSGCHGPLGTSGKAGATVTMIQTAIANNFGGMGKFSSFTAAQIQAIADALAGTPAPTTTPGTGPASGGAPDGAALYTQYCSGCHGPLATSSKRGATAAMIQTGISSVGAMGSFSNLTTAQIQAIAAALGGSPAPSPAPTPTDGASLYATYCSGCHGPLATSSKRGATATMIQTGISSVGAMSSLSVLTTTQIQAIAGALATTTPTPTPAPTSTDGATLYTTYCSGCHGALASSSKAGRTAAQITAAIGSVSQMSSLSTLTSTQISAIASALATSTPTPTPAPTDGAALYTTYCSSCHGTLAASSKAGRTAAQITTAIGSVSQMSSLSVLTSTQIQAIASALATAPAPAPTDGAALYTSYCSSCHGALASSSVRGVSASTISSALSSVSQMSAISLTSTQIQSIATALGTTATPSPTPTPTTTDGATLYTTYCSSCHGPLATSSKAGRTAAQITTAIGSVSQMSSLSVLTSTQIQAIASALATAPAPAPTDGAGLYTSYCSSCHGALASSSVRGVSASTISSALSSVSQMRSISLTSTQIQSIAGALGGSASTSTSTGGDD